jgi:phenylacetate-coenzyme A ligase PaaK-like adenylate-forming protein
MWDTLRFYAGFVDSILVGKKSRPALERIQDARLRRLLRHAVRRSRFYRRKYQGLNLERVKLTDLPTVSKTELMEHFDEVMTDPRITRAGVEKFVADPANIDRHFLGRYAVCHTSGSQGRPALIVQDRSVFRAIFAMQLARGNAVPKTVGNFFYHLRHPRRWAVFLLRPGFFPTGTAFGNMPQPVRWLTDVRRYMISDPFAENLTKLNEYQPNYISGYAHILLNLAAAQEAGKLDLRSGGHLTLMVNISEPLSAEHQARIEAVFGVPVANHYAMGECMPLSLGCPRFGGAHVNVDLAILEVVDRQGRPVPDGTPGDKVYVTNLCNSVQPFIRYEIDDVVTLSERPCACGSALPHIRAVAGRNNDRLWVVIHGRYQELPNFLFTSALHTVFDLAEYQVEQFARNGFRIFAQPIPGRTLAPETVLKALRTKLDREGLTPHLTLEVQLVDEVRPDSRTGKFRRFRSLVPQPSDPLAAPCEPELAMAGG